MDKAKDGTLLRENYVKKSVLSGKGILYSTLPLKTYKTVCSLLVQINRCKFSLGENENIVVYDENMALVDGVIG